MAEQEHKWKEEELRTDDNNKLLENTKKLAEMYSEVLNLKKSGWENVLRARAKREEKEKQNG